MTYSVSIAERRCDGLRGCLEAEAGLNRLLGAEHLYLRSILYRYGRSLTIQHFPAIWSTQTLLEY